MILIKLLISALTLLAIGVFGMSLLSGSAILYCLGGLVVNIFTLYFMWGGK